MINIFGQNINSDKFDGMDHFIARTVDIEISTKVEEQAEEFGGLQKKASVPKYISVIQYIAFLGAGIITVSFIRALGNVSFQKAIDNAMVLLLVGALLWVVFAVIFVVRYFKNKQVENSDQFKEAIEESERIYEESLDDLKVPLDSKKVDIFIYPYKLKKGTKVQAIKQGKYLVYEFKLFKEEDNLCISDTSVVLSMPISSFRKIEKINKKVSFLGWNKDEAPNKGEYKEYKIKTNDYDTHWIKPYYRFELESDFTPYEFYVPAYDAQPLIDLIQLPIVDLSVGEEVDE